MNFALADFLSESVRQMKSSFRGTTEEPKILEISGYLREMLGIPPEFMGLRVRMLRNDATHIIVRPESDHSQFRCVWIPAGLGR